MKIYGKNPVLERLKSNPQSIKRIFVQAGHPEHSYIAGKAKKHGIPVLVSHAQHLMKLGKSANTQGLIMDVEEFTYFNYEELLDVALQEKLTLVFLDGLTDPQNFGGILRTAGSLGGLAIVIPTHDSVQVTDTVLRVACGGENFVKVARVNNLGQAIQKAKDRDFTIAGSVVKDGESIYDVQLPFPLGVVIGSEDKGVRDVIQQRLDIKITIPMAQPRMSLNAAHATTVFCYEINKQRKAFDKKA
ncbi:MAG: 23S rRNA (guanosine(2251)-2'-O)-methyltransferase RlmB [Candidatus Omnitrophica bacterium]|nr:23S rRNA (guanosine(2251)-2'-O)-methyltransferase RlmB [Candidatus Omnitrophota bacterium]